MIALTTRFRPEARKAWLSNERSRISPRSWKNTARLSLWAASPLFKPAWQRLRRAGSEYHSIMNSVRSRLPSSRRAHTEPEIVRCFQGGEGGLRHQLFVHGPEGATALNSNVAGSQPLPK